MSDNIKDIEQQDIRDIEDHVENIKKALDTERAFYQNEIIRLQNENIILRKELQQIWSQWKPDHLNNRITVQVANSMKK